MKALAPLLIFLAASAGAALADLPTPVCDPLPLPAGRIVEKAPPITEWEVDYSHVSEYGGSRAMDAAQTRKIVVTQTGSLWHVQVVRMNGTSIHTYWDGVNRFEVGPKATDIRVVNSGSAASAGGIFDGGTDFPDVAWISRTNYLGMQNGTINWVFQRSKGGELVWIDSSTQFPVRWQLPGETRTLVFHHPPAGSLVLPPGIVALSKHLREVAAEEGIPAQHL